MLAHRVQPVPFFSVRNLLLQHENRVPYRGQALVVRGPVGAAHGEIGVFHRCDYNQCMQSLWNDADAARCDSELALRAYSSRLLGSDPALVLYGGGNTSIKQEEYGEKVLYVKGTGIDLAMVREQDFTPLRLDAVARLLERPALDNADMVRLLEHGIVRRPAPRPSIETLMHAGLPFRCVEHAHADTILAALSVESMATIHAEVYGDVAPLVPYHHSGHSLARACIETFREHGSQRTIGLILAFHGVVAFGDHVRAAYEHMIELVSRAERYLHSRGAWTLPADGPNKATPDHQALDETCRQIHALAGLPLAMQVASDTLSMAFVRRPDLHEISQQGPATPQHAVYTRRVPMIGHDASEFAARYRAYLDTHLGHANSARMDAAPRILLDPDIGVCAFGASERAAQIALDMYQHDIVVITRASAHGRYRSAPPAAIAQAEFEYGGYAALAERKRA